MYNADTAPATPVPAQASSASPELRSYALEVGPLLTGTAPTLRRISELSSRAGGNPSITLDRTWRDEMGIMLGTLRGQGFTLQQARRVPEEAREMDALVCSIGADMVYVADEMVAGIDGMSSTRINNAVAPMNTMNEKLNRGARMANDWAAKYR